MGDGKISSKLNNEAHFNAVRSYFDLLNLSEKAFLAFVYDNADLFELRQYEAILGTETPKKPKLKSATNLKNLKTMISERLSKNKQNRRD